MACTCVSGDSPSVDVLVVEPPLSLDLSLPSPSPFNCCRATTARETGAGSSEASEYSMSNMIVISLSSMFRTCSFRFGSPKMPNRSAELSDRWTAAHEDTAKAVKLQSLMNASTVQDSESMQRVRISECIADRSTSHFARLGRYSTDMTYERCMFQFQCSSKSFIEKQADTSRR